MVVAQIVLAQMVIRPSGNRPSGNKPIYPALAREQFLPEAEGETSKDTHAHSAQQYHINAFENAIAFMRILGLRFWQDCVSKRPFFRVSCLRFQTRLN